MESGAMAPPRGEMANDSFYGCGFFFFFPLISYLRVSQVALAVKNPPADVRDKRDAGRSLGPEDPLEGGMAAHSSSHVRILVTPWTVAHQAPLLKGILQ